MLNACLRSKPPANYFEHWSMTMNQFHERILQVAPAKTGNLEK